MFTLRMQKKLEGLYAEDAGAESGGGGESYQTTVDQTGQEAAGEPAPAEGDDWADLAQGENEEPSFEAQEDTEGAGEAEEPAPTGGEEQETPAEEEAPQEGDEEQSEHQEEEQQEPEQQEDVWARYEQARQQAVEKLTENYQISDEEADQILENPQEVLPKKFAQLYTDVFEDVMQAVTANLPNLLEQVESGKQQQQKAEEEFYSEWPNLRGYEDTVERVAKAYKQQNPNVDRKTFIQEVGAQASWAVKAPPQEDTPQEETPAPHQPAAPGSRGGQQPGPSASEPTTEFEEIHMEDYG